MKLEVSSVAAPGRAAPAWSGLDRGEAAEPRHGGQGRETAVVPADESAPDARPGPAPIRRWIAAPRSFANR